MKEKPVLTDKDLFPSEEVIFTHIGKAKNLWVSLFEHIHSRHPDFSETWKFYRDGNCWLLKVSQKKKTVFWLSVLKNSFRTTFYFSEKAEEMIIDAAVSEHLKELYRNAEKSARLRGLTISWKKRNDLEDAKALIEIKSAMK